MFKPRDETRSSFVNRYLRPLDIAVLTTVIALPLMLADKPEAAQLVVSLLVPGQ